MNKKMSTPSLLNFKGIPITSDNVNDFYTAYLSTEKEDYNKVIRRPCRSAILKALLKVHQAQTINASDYIQKALEEDKKIWYWSDQHFNHHNIIKYSSRPFNSTSHMNDTMRNNYLMTVSEDDLVIFGGDIAFGPTEEAFKYLTDLPGKKVLIVGNHDFDKNQLIFKDYGIFDATAMSALFTVNVEDTDCKVILTHYPIDSNLLPENTINIHGHIHQYKAGDKNINMAVEQTGYSPVDLTQQIKDVFKMYCSSKSKSLKI